MSADGSAIVFENAIGAAGKARSDVHVWTESAGVELISAIPEDAKPAGKSYVRGRSPITEDGRLVVFESEARTLSVQDSDEYRDIFLRDRQTAVTRLVSVSADGRSGDGDSCLGSISANGQAIIFVSSATNLDPDQPLPEPWLYQASVKTGEIRSLAPVGSTFSCQDDLASDWAPDIAGDASRIVFVSADDDLDARDRNASRDVFEISPEGLAATLISVDLRDASGNGSSDQPSLSSDGTVVAFRSEASMLTDESVDGGWPQVFVRDLGAGTTMLASISSGGEAGDQGSHHPVIAGDASQVTFSSTARNLVVVRWWEDPALPSIMSYNVDSGIVEREVVNIDIQPVAGDPVLSPGPVHRVSLAKNANYVVFDSKALLARDFEFDWDVWRFRSIRRVPVQPTVAATPESSRILRRISVDVNGEEGELNRESSYPSISPDAVSVAFITSDANLTRLPADHVFDAVVLRDRRGEAPSYVGEVARDPHQRRSFSPPAVGADGLAVAYSASTESPGTLKLVHPGRGTAHYLCPDVDPYEFGHDCIWPSISGDGSAVSFQSGSPTIVDGDANGVVDIFVYDAGLGEAQRISTSRDGGDPNGPSGYAALSEDGMTVVFASEATNLVEEDTNGFADIFAWDRRSGRIDLVSRLESGDQSNGHSAAPSVSADGRWIAFSSRADNLVPTSHDAMGSEDIFLVDRIDHSIQRITDGKPVPRNPGDSYGPSISSDGRYVTFASRARGILDGVETHDRAQVYLYDVWDGTMHLVSESVEGGGGILDSGLARVASRDGLPVVVFASAASDLVPDDRNFAVDVFEYSSAELPLPTSISRPPSPTPQPEPTPGENWAYLPVLVHLHP